MLMLATKHGARGAKETWIEKYGVGPDGQINQKIPSESTFQYQLNKFKEKGDMNNQVHIMLRD
jgi:hypothetical protein